MVSTQIKNAYSEVYVILNKLNLISKLPDIIVTEILNEKSNEHYFDFNVENPLYEQVENIDTISIFSYLYVKYLCDDKEEKEWLISKYKDNEIKYQKELAEKYSVDNLFKNKKTETIIEKIVGTEMTIYQELPIYKRIFIKIKEFFTRNNRSK